MIELKTNVSNEEIIKSYLNHWRSSKYSVSNRKSCLKYFFGNEKDHFHYQGHVFDINTGVLVDYFDHLNHLKSLAIGTKKSKWTTITSFLNYTMEKYYEHGFIVKIPTYTTKWNVTHKKANSNKHVLADISDITRILGFFALRDYKYYLIFRILVETGMRVGELTNLTIDGVNLEKRYLNTTGKTGEKTYYISKEFVLLLKVYVDNRKTMDIADRSLLISQLTKKSYERNAFNRRLKKALISLGIEKRISCHTFRKTLNTLRKKMGCDNDTCKILLGHKVNDVNIASYTIYNNDEYLAIADKWNPYKDIQL